MDRSCREEASMWRYPSASNASRFPSDAADKRGRRHDMEPVVPRFAIRDPSGPVGNTAFCK